MKNLLNEIKNDTIGKYDFYYAIDGNGVIDVSNSWTGYVVVSEDHWEDNYGDMEVCSETFKDLNVEDRKKLANILIHIASIGRDRGNLKDRIDKSEIIKNLELV